MYFCLVYIGIPFYFILEWTWDETGQEQLPDQDCYDA